MKEFIVNSQCRKDLEHAAKAWSADGNMQHIVDVANKIAADSYTLAITDLIMDQNKRLSERIESGLAGIKEILDSLQSSTKQGTC